MPSVAQELARHMESGSRVAVVGVFARETPSLGDMGTILTETLTTELVPASQGRFVVLERRLIHAALQELDFQTSDLVDQRKAGRAGRFLGANVVISGTATPRGRKCHVHFRAIQVESLQILAVAQTTVDAPDGRTKRISSLPAFWRASKPELLPRVIALVTLVFPICLLTAVFVSAGYRRSADFRENEFVTVVIATGMASIGLAIPAAVLALATGGDSAPFLKGLFSPIGLGGAASTVTLASYLVLRQGRALRLDNPLLWIFCGVIGFPVGALLGSLLFPVALPMAYRVASGTLF